ncbi:MAG: diacylglycerol/polyprenol kinase family protein [Nanoarchaeota archaeon]
MKKRWNFLDEVGRKVVHLMSIFLIVLFVIVARTAGRRWALFSLVGLLILFMELEYVRIELRQRIPLLWRVWRHQERNRIGSQIFFLLGAIIAFAVFDFRIAVAAILMTTFGDMVAALVGKKFGRVKIFRSQTFEGSFAEFVVDVLIGAFLIGNLWIVLGMALTATVVEVVAHKLDDNLLIPVCAGFVGQILVVFL